MGRENVHNIDPLSGLTNGGLYSAVVFAAVVVVALATLYVRYDEVER